MGRAGRECDREGRKGPAWPSVEGQAAERVPQCKVFSQGAPAEELDEAPAAALEDVCHRLWKIKLL